MLERQTYLRIITLAPVRLQLIKRAVDFCAEEREVGLQRRNMHGSDGMMRFGPWSLRGQQINSDVGIGRKETNEWGLDFPIQAQFSGATPLACRIVGSQLELCLERLGGLS